MKFDRVLEKKNRRLISSMNKLYLQQCLEISSDTTIWIILFVKSRNFQTANFRSLLFVNVYFS